jgi:phosphonoacetate hydrolase
MVTAKDKLRLLLSHGLDYAQRRAIAFSAERADQASRQHNGIDDVLGFVGRPGARRLRNFDAFDVACNSVG